MKTIIPMKVGQWEREYVLMLTDAPRSYDGFGTFTLFDPDCPLEVDGVMTKGNVRLVMVPTQHEGWQEGRYASGLHLAKSDGLEEAGLIDVKACEDALVTLCTTDVPNPWKGVAA